jgi:hypothetical protein
MLEDEEDVPEGLDRRELYERGVARSESFIAKLENWIAEYDLGDDVKSISEPMAFPMIMVRTTKKIALRIEELPDVRAVIRDDGVFRTVE